ncbi:MAG: hypothetical protein WKF70_04790, partial [Chitinophagaceae bacterium]
SLNVEAYNEKPKQCFRRCDGVGVQAVQPRQVLENNTTLRICLGNSSNDNGKLSAMAGLHAKRACRPNTNNNK